LALQRSEHVKSFALTAALLQVAQVGPSATSSPLPLKVITNVKSSRMCDTLAHNVFQAIQGLQANDALPETNPGANGGG
jgi:hypothetical protein